MGAGSEQRADHRALEFNRTTAFAANAVVCESSPLVHLQMRMYDTATRRVPASCAWLSRPFRAQVCGVSGSPGHRFAQPRAVLFWPFGPRLKSSIHRKGATFAKYFPCME